MNFKKLLVAAALLVPLTASFGVQAHATPAAARITLPEAATPAPFELAAKRKYHRLKPGCRASFCRPGYDWGDYRRYERRKNFGRFVAGVTLGAVIITAANTIPRRPSPDLCWYWSNNSRTRGYWDYCY